MRRLKNMIYDVVKFYKRSSRDKWIKHFKEESRKYAEGPGIPSQKINPQLPASRISIGEHLTTYTRDLLNAARDFAKERGFQFVWTRDCKVFIRKDERSQALKISSHNNLKNL